MRSFFVYVIILFYSGSGYAQTFLPSDISGLSLWFSADSINVINGRVAIWYDLSGNNNSAIQADTLMQPVVLPNNPVINNQPSVKFDGTDDYLQFNDVNNIKTAFLVFNHDPAFRVYDNLIGHSTNATGALLSGGLYSLIYYSANWLNIAFLNGNSVSPYSLYQDSLYTILSLEPSPDGVANTISHNGYQGYNPWKGNVAEVLFYDKVLSNTERLAVQQYLNNKYSPKVSLGSDVNIPYGFCNYQLDAGSVFKSFLWSTGDTTRTIAVADNGQYWVTTTDVFGLQSSDTITVKFPGKLHQNDTTICYGTSFTWNTGLSAAAYTFQWQDNSALPAFTIFSDGQYFARIFDTLGCFTYTDTAFVGIDSFPLIASLGNDTSLCSGNFIFLQSGAQDVSTSQWQDGSTNDSLQVSTPGGLYWVNLTSTTGCLKTDSINITIAGEAPLTNFSASNLCIGSSTQFTDLSVPPSGDTIVSWVWDFGDLGFSAQQNPLHTYADTGTYSVFLKVTTNEGCSAEIIKPVHIYALPVATFFASNLCEDAGAFFNGNAVTYNDPVSAWNWNFADPASGSFNFGTAQNPSHYYTSAASYSVSLIITTLAGCQDTVNTSVVIKPAPVADFTSTNACSGLPVQFTNTSVLPPFTTLSSSFWSFGDGSPNSTSVHVSHIYTGSAIVNIMHVVTSSNGCKDTVIRPLPVNPAPLAGFSTLGGCVFSSVPFTDLSTVSSGNINDWNWTFNNSGASVLQNPQYLFASAGSMSVRLIVTSDQGCKDTLIQSVTINPQPIASFTQSADYGSPPLSVNFMNTSVGAINSFWIFGDSSTSFNTNPVHIFNDTGSFQVSLIASNTFGCSDTAFREIQVNKRLIDVSVSQLSTVVQNGFLNVSAKFENHGSSDVYSLDVFVRINDGTYLKQAWAGFIPRNGSVNYTLPAATAMNAAPHYVCLNIQNPNGDKDDIPENNELCKSIEEGLFQSFPVFPNPVDEMLTIPLYIPAADAIDVLMYNDAGKKIDLVLSENLNDGFHTLYYDTSALPAGLYVLKFNYAGKVTIQKFIKR